MDDELNLFDDNIDQTNAINALGALYVLNDDFSEAGDGGGGGFHAMPAGVMEENRSESSDSEPEEENELINDAAEGYDKCTCKRNCYTVLLNACNNRINRMTDEYTSLPRSQQDMILIGYLSGCLVTPLFDNRARKHHWYVTYILFYCHVSSFMQ